jgi:polysaccharide biosynthesis protein PslH
LRFVHITFEKPLSNGTGAPLRSHAIFAALAEFTEVRTIVVAEEFLAEGLRHALTPAHIEVDVPQRVMDRILDKAQIQQGDTVVLNGVFLSQLAPYLLGRGAQVILDAHNVESALLREVDRARRPLLARLKYSRRWQRAHDAETALFGAVAAIWACSAQDAEKMRHIAPRAAPIHIVPNPVPIWALDATSMPRGGGIRALLVGHLGYGPNLNAAKRLITHILPALRQIDPAAGLTLAGRHPGRSVTRLAAANPAVHLIANPADLAPIYADANMAVVPLREGGGTRIKVLEAMAAGLAVVASAKAVEGLALIAGRDYLQAESDAEFVNAMLTLSENAHLRADLAASGRAFALGNHGPKAISASINSALLAIRGNP